MRNSTKPRIAWRLPWAACGALAFGPFVAGLACNVYDNSLLGDVSTPLGGSGATAGSAGSGVSGGGSVAGGSTGGSVSGAAGVANGGKAGDSPSTAGNAGTSTTGGGGSATAGSAGMGAGGEPEPSATEMIDDMEDGDPEIDVVGGRNGYWYVGGDLTAGATTDPPSAKFAMAKLAVSDRSAFAAHLKAVGYKDWGSVMGFNFTELSTVVKPYDGSAFCGMQFWGKAAAATTVRFRIPDIDTHQAGNVCKDPPAGAGTACYDHFGTSFSFGTAWKLFSAKFSDLAQAGTGYHPADMKLKSDKLMAVEWALAGTGTTYEIWIDDVEFIKCK